MLKILCWLFFCISPIFSDQWLALGAGICGIVRPKDQTPMFQIEYQPDPIFKASDWFNIRPQAGFFMNFRTAFYLYGGFRFEFMPTPWLIITPGFAPGLYIRGQSKKLHFPIEFKSSIELAVEYKQHSRRLGIQFYHISNASIGYRNPGTEMLVVTYSIKL